jgi:hypothetical protein
MDVIIFFAGCVVGALCVVAASLLTADNDDYLTL